MFTNNTLFKKGKAQLAEYLKSENLDEGYYVVFSNVHNEENTLYFEEQINDKQIYTYIICTNFPIPSNLPVPKQITDISVTTTRKNILEILALRFDPPYSIYQELEQQLLTVSDEAMLKKLLIAAVQSENIRGFQSEL